MAASRKTPFVSVNLTPEARDALRQRSFELSASLGRRVTLSETVHALLREKGQKDTDLRQEQP